MHGGTGRLALSARVVFDIPLYSLLSSFLFMTALKQSCHLAVSSVTATTGKLSLARREAGRSRPRETGKL